MALRKLWCRPACPRAIRVVEGSRVHFHQTMRTYVCDEMSFTRFSLAASCSFTHRSSLGGELRASPGAVAASPLLRPTQSAALISPSSCQPW